MLHWVVNRRIYSHCSFAILLVVLATSCSLSVETDAVCDSADRWNLASTGLAKISSDFETTSPGRIRDVFNELVSTLNTMSEIAPPQIVVSIEKLAETYGAFSAALEEIDWPYASHTLGLPDLRLPRCVLPCWPSHKQCGDGLGRCFG